jgi:hypothetical protein
MKMMKQLTAFTATFTLQALLLVGVAYASPATQVLAIQATPSHLPATGGTMSVAAKVSGATSCWLVTLPGSVNVKVTLPTPAGCAKGSYDEKVVLGPNRVRHPVMVELELFASHPNVIAADSLIDITVAAAPAPAAVPGVISATTTPRGLPANGGIVTVIGHVVGARACRLSVLANPANVKVTLPAPADCSTGTYTAPVVFGANPKTTAAVVKLGLFPAGSVRKYAGVLYVELAPQ